MVFSTTASVLAFALGLCLFAAPALAQERRTVVFGSIGFAGIGHADSGQGNAPLFGGGIGTFLTPSLVVEGDAHWASVSHVFDRDQHDFAETTVTGSLLYRSTPDRGAHFIAGGGAGLQWARIHVDDPPLRIDRTETIRLLHGRIGGEWDVSSRMALRTEAVLWFGEGLDWVLGARVSLGYRF